MSIEIVVDSKNVDSKMKRLENALSERMIARFFQGRITTWFQSRVQYRFAHQGDATVGAWAPLAAASVRIRRSAGYGAGPINVRTGDMESWATQGTFADAPGGGAGVVSMRFPERQPTGSLKKKVMGAQGMDKRYKARPILAIDERDLEATMNALGDDIMRYVG